MALQVDQISCQLNCGKKLKSIFKVQWIKAVYCACPAWMSFNLTLSFLWEFYKQIYQKIREKVIIILQCLRLSVWHSRDKQIVEMIFWIFDWSAMQMEPQFSVSSHFSWRIICIFHIFCHFFFRFSFKSFALHLWTLHECDESQLFSCQNWHC